MMNIKLKVKIIEHFHTQSDFAQAMGVDESAVSRAIRNRRLPKPGEQEKWARFLGSSAQEIFGDEVIR